jgi:glycosyltransferase involved in cell wall biosynthesis
VVYEKSLSNLKRVLLIQVVVPSWRRTLYEKLRDSFLESGYDLCLAYDFEARTKGHLKSSGEMEDISCVDLDLVDLFGKAKFLRGIQDTILQIKPDIVITDANPRFLSAWELGGLKKKHNYMLIGWSSGHFHDNGPLATAIKRRFFARFDGMLAYTDRAFQLFRDVYQVVSVRAVGNAIDDIQVRNEIESMGKQSIIALREQLIGRGRLLVLFVGKLTRGKRVDVLLRAAKRLPDYSFVVIGSGPEERALRQEASSLSNVRFMGRIEDGVNAYFQAADVFILPGLGGLALVQALHNGLPIISSPADGIGYEVVANGVNGFMSEEVDEDFIVESLAKMQDIEVRRTFSEKSRQLAQGFKVEQVASNIVKFVSKLDGGR